MNIKSVHIKNFRAIQNELLYFDKLTALIGPTVLENHHFYMHLIHFLTIQL